MPHFMILLILYINFIKSFLDEKMSIFEEYGAFSEQNDMQKMPCFILISLLNVCFGYLLELPR